MEATLNGAAFTSGNTTAVMHVTGSTQQLQIGGTSYTNQRITLALNGFNAATTTYTMNGGNGAAIGAFNSGVSGQSDVIGTSGQVVITSIDNTSNLTGTIYKGTFYFSVSPYTITAGTFSVLVRP
jgi:hypothetical protein